MDDKIHDQGTLTIHRMIDRYFGSAAGERDDDLSFTVMTWLGKGVFTTDKDKALFRSFCKICGVEPGALLEPADFRIDADTGTKA